VNNKQTVFVAEYLKDFNASRAARAAGYSAKSAYSIGQELLKKLDIEAAIKAEISERSMGASEVLTRLASIARGDLGQFMDIESMSFDISLQKAKELGLTHLIKKVKQVTKTTMKTTGEDEETNVQEIELYSSLEALQVLAKVHGLMVDRSDITSGGDKIFVTLKAKDDQ
jgi:phage terminase small subunit